MRNPYSIFALAALLLLPAGTIVAADAPSPANDSQATGTDPAEPASAAAETPVPEPMDVAETFDEFVGQYPDEQYLTTQDAPYQPWLATRFGWWGLSTSGAPYGVGEWQGLNTSTPFWDVDGITSDGVRTIDFFATGPEDEANQAGLYVYGGPGLSMDLDYNRFIHRLGHDPYGGLPDANGFPPLGGFYDPPLNATVPGNPMWGQDLNVGQDYAIRVQQLKANFKGRLTENLSWGLNVWGMKKEGVRQTNSVTHCYDARRGLDALIGTVADNHPLANSGTCHLVSKGQHIDWLTMEIEPVLTARFGWLTLEYSRTMRSFQQGDDLVTFRHTRNPSLGYGDFATTGIEPAYAYASENYTEIDRLKVLADVAPNTDLYVLGFVGNTHNRFRESDRKFYGVDARVTNSTFDGLMMTVYGKTFGQNSSSDDIALNTRYPTQATTWVEPVAPTSDISPASPPAILIDRFVAAAGLKGRWRPFYASSGWASPMAVVGGYEYRQLDRDNVTYVIEPFPSGTFTQPDTATNMFFVGLEQDLTSSLNAYVRYRLIANQNPLVGVTPAAEPDAEGTTVSTFNSLVPEHEDRIEIGGNWNPTKSFLLNASFWIQNAYNHSGDFVNFDEDSYPIVVSACYTPDDRWSLTGGYATFSNWIDQDVTLSSDIPFTNEWNYAGRADVFNLGASYAWTCRMTLTGGVEYVRTRNVFADPPDRNGVAYDPLAVYSAVRVNTWRLTAGTDYRLTDTTNTYFRYNYFDYEDAATGWNTGTAHMFLAGLSGVF